MAYPIELKEKVIQLRKKGYSLNEIVEKVEASKSSVSAWVRNIPLNKKARNRLLTKIKLGQLISAENKRKKTNQILDNFYQESLKQLKIKNFDKFTIQLICSLIYYCEGNKNFGGVNFTNSDPNLIKTFLFLFRSGFDIDEKKFRPCVHLHKYHNSRKQIDFWSKITKISKKQFIKPYLKPNTGKRIRKNYQGCIAIRYHSANVARNLIMTAKSFLENYKLIKGGMV